MGMFEAQEKSPVEYLVMKLHSTRKRSELEKQFNSKSPFAITTKEPSSRIVDNAITKGNWHTSPISTSTQRGFFGKVRGVALHGGASSGRIDTEVQFDEIFKCPVTGREFMAKQLDRYKESLRSEVRYYAEGLLHETVVQTDPMSDEVTIITDGMTFKISHEHIVELLSSELESLDFIAEIVKYKVKEL